MVYIIKIDDLTLEFVNATPSMSTKFKDYDMQNGDTTRYTTRKNIVSLSCKGMIDDKSELENFKATMLNDEHTVEYQLDGIQTAVMLHDNVSYSKIALTDSFEYWEVSFTLKESRRLT